MEGTIDAMSAWIRAKFQVEEGASLVEYALLLMLIAVAALVAVKAFGEGVSTQFSRITNSVNS
jgi:Flp pilus assembly pilin Flp